MPNIKSLTLHLRSLTDLLYIMSSVINIIELNLSILDFGADFSKYNKLEYQNLLNKLHLELHQSSSLQFKRMNKFLSLFQNQLQSLTLIAISGINEEFAIFSTLYKQFIVLLPSGFDKVKKLPDDTYEVYTRLRPIIVFEKHRPCQNNYRINSEKDRSLKELYNVTSIDLEDWLRPLSIIVELSCSFMLTNLHKVAYNESTES
ncbi:unnamed protein product [Rotaria sp. Silwood2]|nr:unnamed protein product [Rotaria sp. Silwood2]